jgi:hypothetical protein
MIGIGRVIIVIGPGPGLTSILMCIGTGRRIGIGRRIEIIARQTGTIGRGIGIAGRIDRPIGQTARTDQMGRRSIRTANSTAGRNRL